MRILYIYDHFPGAYQGYMKLLLDLLRDKQSVQVMTYEDSSESNYHIKSYGIKNRFRRILFKIGLLKHKSIDAKLMYQFDIVHLQHSHLWKKSLLLTEQEHSPKLVITLRGSDTYIKPWRYIRLRNFYSRNHSKVSAFIVVSKHQKDYLQRWGVPEEKIFVIPISFGHYSNATPKFPNKESMKLVSAFRMTWEKNIDGTIRFAKLLKDRGISFTYDIYGDGPDLGQLYYLLDRYDLYDYIHIQERIDYENLKTRLPNYDFYVQLSISEALSASVIEAQASGLPCVVSNSDGLPEAVIENKTALIGHYTEIESLASACVDLWKDRERYHTFSRDAIAFVNAHFTIEKEVERLETLYKSL